MKRETWLTKLKENDYDSFLAHQRKASALSKGDIIVSEDRKKQMSEITKRTHREWKKRDLIGYIKHQKNANSMRIYLPMKESTKEKLSILAKQRKPNTKYLLKWKRENPELARNISSETITKTNLKYPNMSSETAKITHIKYPDLAYKMGHSTQIKHPNQSSIIIKQTNKRLMREEPEKYIAQRRKTATELNKKYPNLKYRRVEMQSAKGFISKPQKIMRQLLSTDFVMDKQFGDSIPDFRSKERKIIIEVDGEYWHGSKFPKNIEKDNRHNKEWIEKEHNIFRIPSKDVNTYFKPLLSVTK